MNFAIYMEQQTEILYSSLKEIKNIILEQILQRKQMMLTVLIN